ncbi:MAG: hypothetical protein AB7V77_02325 [Candidatus Woesearchaeota archaeon]
MVEKVKIDARVHLDDLKKIEVSIVNKINELEKSIKKQLVELQITRDLIKEITDKISDGVFDEKVEKEISKSIERLEEVVKGVEVKKKEMKIEEQPYLLRKEDLALVTSYDTVKRLYDLAYKQEWTYQEAKEFAGIKYNLNKAFKEEFNPIIQNRLDNTYKALQAISEKKPETMKYDFKSGLENKLSGDVKPVDAKEYLVKPDFKFETPKKDVKYEAKKNLKDNVDVKYKNN